jgi:hypothetical protein
MWYGYALLGPVIWAMLNHVDKYLLGRFFKGDAPAPVLVVFTGFAGFLVSHPPPQKIDVFKRAVRREG